MGTFVKKILGEDIVFKTVIKDAELPVNVDGGQIEQVLINLTTNARDAMPDGGKLTISTDTMYINTPFIYGHGFEEPGGYAVITVADTGHGMDEDTCKRIFEPFFSTKEVGKGTGLGLAMVQGIVKQHNGHVDVSSEPGHGTSFVILLPILESENTGTEAENRTTEMSKGTETILIAEDDDSLREFSYKMLTRLGYKVILAVDGQDAVDKFRDNADAIQLIIMDMIMPHKSGKKAYDEILQIRP
ncbi:MAG: ATP-binding protein, partial [Deltaproteobacteria bacterium]